MHRRPRVCNHHGWVVRRIAALRSGTVRRAKPASMVEILTDADSGFITGPIFSVTDGQYM
jgi:hypothetical protein